MWQRSPWLPAQQRAVRGSKTRKGWCPQDPASPYLAWSQSANAHRAETQAGMDGISPEMGLLGAGGAGGTNELRICR